MLMNEIERLVKEVELPENWMVKENFSLCKFVLRTTLKNSLFEPKSDNEKNEFQKLIESSSEKMQDLIVKKQPLS